MQNSEKTWVKEEPGWYCADGVGGICKERDGKWYYYPLRMDEGLGGFDTLKEAKEFAKRMTLHAP